VGEGLGGEADGRGACARGAVGPRRCRWPCWCGGGRAVGGVCGVCERRVRGGRAAELRRPHGRAGRTRAGGLCRDPGPRRPRGAKVLWRVWVVREGHGAMTLSPPSTSRGGGGVGSSWAAVWSGAGEVGSGVAWVLAVVHAAVLVGADEEERDEVHRPAAPPRPRPAGATRPLCGRVRLHGRACDATLRRLSDSAAAPERVRVCETCRRELSDSSRSPRSLALLTRPRLAQRALAQHHTVQAMLVHPRPTDSLPSSSSSAALSSTRPGLPLSRSSSSLAPQQHRAPLRQPRAAPAYPQQPPADRSPPAMAAPARPAHGSAIPPSDKENARPADPAAPAAAQQDPAAKDKPPKDRAKLTQQWGEPPTRIRRDHSWLDRGDLLGEVRPPFVPRLGHVDFKHPH